MDEPYIPYSAEELRERATRELTRDPAEEACYQIQQACWQFQTSIERAETGGRIAFIAGMLEESRKRLGLVCTYAAAKELELKR